MMKKGFTIIELLIVLAIIAILVGLAMAAYQKSRSSANRVKCSNNLRQIGLALNGYYNLNSKLPSGQLWYYNEAKLSSYIENNWNILNCPAINPNDYYNNFSELPLYSYGYNIIYLPDKNLLHFSTSNTVAFGDCGIVSYWQVPPVPTMFAPDVIYPPSMNSPTNRYVHINNTNILYLDGSVRTESLKIRGTVGDQALINYRDKMNLGIFGTDDTLWGKN